MFFFCLKNIKFDLLKRGQFVVIFFSFDKCSFHQRSILLSLESSFSKVKPKNQQFERSSFRIFFSLISV